MSIFFRLLSSVADLMNENCFLVDNNIDISLCDLLCDARVLFRLSVGFCGSCLFRKDLHGEVFFMAFDMRI